MTGPSRKVSIHLQGDADDGPTHVFVDGNLVATVDMFTSPGAETVVILVENLPLAPHSVDVSNLGSGDSSILGAASLGVTPPLDGCDPPQLGGGLGWAARSPLPIGRAIARSCY